MSGSGRDLGRSWRDRDHGFGRPERTSPDREKSWRRKEEPDLPPVTAPAAQAPRRSFEVHHIAEGALEKLHITQGEGEWLEDGDDMSRLAPPAWLLQDSKHDGSVPEPRKDNAADSSPRVKVIARPKEQKTPFRSAKLPEHLRNSKREPGEEKKLWTPPKPIGSAAKKSGEKTHISPAKTSSKHRRLAYRNRGREKASTCFLVRKLNLSLASRVPQSHDHRRRRQTCPRHRFRRARCHHPCRREFQSEFHLDHRPSRPGLHLT